VHVGDGLVFAYLLDGKGGAKAVGWEFIKSWKPADGLLWVHLDYTGAQAKLWLDEVSGLDPVTREALRAEETRPRSVINQKGLMLMLRGVNLNPGADPEDMVSIRLWLDQNRIISLRQRKVMAVDAVRKRWSLATVRRIQPLSWLISQTTSPPEWGAVLSDLDDAVDSLEDEVLTAESYELRAKIGSLRREAISLRRFLAPQRDAMARLHTERVSWLDELNRIRLREIADRITRYVEDLDSARDRAAVVQEELNSRLSEQMNKTMYVLSIVAGIFLPLGLITGLLGINVGGIPGTASQWAFAFVCACLIAVGIVQVFVFKRKGWM
jgi:zinc transporter